MLGGRFGCFDFSCSGAGDKEGASEAGEGRSDCVENRERESEGGGAGWPRSVNSITGARVWEAVCAGHRVDKCVLGGRMSQGFPKAGFCEGGKSQ